MEEPMQAPSGDQRITAPSSRLRELGLVLPTPPTPLGAYVESSDAWEFAFPQWHSSCCQWGILIMIYALVRLAWEKNVLIIGLIKDTAAAEQDSHVFLKYSTLQIW